MADDLDDFFAKKDRKKKVKAKPKFLTAEELVKNLEDTTKAKHEAAKAAKKPEQSAAAAVGSGDDGTATENVKPQEEPVAPEEEWDEFEEERRRDYTGLKIGQLTLDDEADQSPTELDDGEDGDGNSEGVENGRSTGGVPWKKVIPAEEVTQIPMDMGVGVGVGKPSDVYISPALRNSQRLMPTSRRNRAAPDITNADYFPSLGAARPEEQRKKKNEPAFEEVRHGGRLQRVPEKQVAPVAAANRFQSLDEDDS